MNKTLTTTITAVLVLAGAAACSNSSDSSTTKAGAPTKPLTASTAFASISGKVPTAKLSGTVTAANDPNHLLGRPGQYSSKVTFNDSRIHAAVVSGTEKGDVDRGGAIEVFATARDATARAKYIEAIVKALPSVSEYDYVNGAVLVRVSHYLTPAQAAGYKSAAASLG